MCTCTGRFSSTLVSSSKRGATASCKICCGRPLVDGIGSVSSGMARAIGLELTPDLTWKIIPKRNRSERRRTRKPVAKSLTMGMGLADENAVKPENVMVSESEKLGVDVLGRHFSEKVKNVPLKKRRSMFQSPSLPPPLASYPYLEASEQHVDFQPAPDQNLGSSAVQWKQLMKSDCSAKSYDSSIDDKKISEVIDGVEDFSGIEMLAAVACSDSVCNDVTEYEENPSVGDSTQKRIQSSTSSTNLEETTVSQETESCFPNDSANGSKYEGSYFNGNSFAVLHEFPSDKDTTPSLPLHEHRSRKRTDLSLNESKSDGSSFQDNSFDVLHEMSIPLPDDRLLWDLNVPLDAWPCGGGNVDSQKDCFDNNSVRSEELQTKEPQDIKNNSAKVVVSSDVDEGARMTSDLGTMPVGTADSSTGKQESGDDSQNIKNDTTNEVVSSDVDEGARMTSDLRTVPFGTADSSTGKQESGDDSQNIKNDTMNEVVSSDVDGGNRMTSVLRIMPVGTDDLSPEKQESGDDSQNIRDDTTIEVVSLDVEADNKTTSNLRTVPVGTDDLTTEKQENEGFSGYDSQIEDGELRESDVQYWEEAEQVDHGTDFEEVRSFGLEAESAKLKVGGGSNPELSESFKISEAGVASRKNSASLKIRTVQVSEAETMKNGYLSGSYYDHRIDLSKDPKKDLLSCVEGSLSSDVVQKSRFDNSNGSYPRAERGVGYDKFMESDRSLHMRGRSPGGSHFFNPSSNYWDSKRPHPSIYHVPYNFGRPRPISGFQNREYPVGTDQIPPEAAGGARPDYCIPRQFMGSYRPLLGRRSPIERDGSYNMHPRMPIVRDTSPDRNRFRRYPQGVSRGIRDEYLRHIPDDSAQYMNRMPHRLDRRERSISPHGGRPHHTIPYKRARSRSRSRSPNYWLLQRDRNDGTRRRNRSPDFKSDARMDMVRLPFTKRFVAGYGEFGSPPRGRVSPQRNSRMFEDRSPGLDHFRGRKSHERMIRQDQRFDQARPIRRLNSNDNFNPMIRPRRFPDRAAGGRGSRYDEVSDDGKHGSRYATINRERCYDTDGGARRFQYNEEDSYMAKNSLTMTNVTGVSSRHSDDGDDTHKTVSEDKVN